MTAPDDGMAERRWEGPAYWRSTSTAELAACLDELEEADIADLDLTPTITALRAELTRRAAARNTPTTTRS